MPGKSASRPPLEVETGKLIDSLKAAFPELRQFELSANNFGPSDIKPGGVKEFCSALVAAGVAKEATPATQVWTLLTEGQKKQIRTLSASQGDMDADAIELLLAVLNSVAGKRELHESAEFQTLTGQDEPTTKSIRESLSGKFDREQSRRPG